MVGGGHDGYARLPVSGREDPAVTPVALTRVMVTWEPVSGFEPLTCRLQDGCSAN